MVQFEYLLRRRAWFPVPQGDGRIHLLRWILLDANRFAVTGALLSFVFVSLMTVGTIWTFEMQHLLTETRAIQDVLTALLRGIILLVSIVVSINSVILSHDITSVETQKDRIESEMEFRREIGKLTETRANPADPTSFLSLMATVIPKRAARLREEVDGTNSEFANEVDVYVKSLREEAKDLKSGSPRSSGAEFGVLWNELRFNYGKYLDWSDTIRRTYDRGVSDPIRERLDDIDRILELFGIGKEYFKTLYYSQELSQLSLTLLVISLPAIIINASAILAVDAGILPGGRVFVLPLRLTFVATIFTVSLAPYLVLTAYMLRLVTVTKETTRVGPFSLRTESIPEDVAASER